MVRSSFRQRFARFSAVVFASGVSLVAPAQTPPDEVLLKDYKPRSLFKIPETHVEKARYALIDVHSHDYAPTVADVDRWVNTMDVVGLEKTIILSGYTGARFDGAMAKYGKHPKRFTEIAVNSKPIRTLPQTANDNGAGSLRQALTNAGTAMIESRKFSGVSHLCFLGPSRLKRPARAPRVAQAWSRRSSARRDCSMTSRWTR